jgi:phosphodiesterase/alkaline phosphatase D-like protein
MPHVIIGDTSSDSVRVWVKGDASSTTCQVTLRSALRREQPRAVQLESDSDYTATVLVGGLDPDTAYLVVATFGPSGTSVRGRVRTFKTLPAPGAPVPFSFVLSSCNLSIVSINDFLARLAATTGAALAMSSLDIAPYRWRRPQSPVLQSVVRFLGKGSLGLVARGIECATGLKQTGSTYLRSPFLKLAAVFESCVVELPLPKKPDREGLTSDKYAEQLQEYTRQMRQLFLAVGDRVESTHGATGVVASMSDDEDKALRRLVITHVDGTFETSAVLFRWVTDKGETKKRRLGAIVGVRVGCPWYEPPSFFIHAGDQIYYDFPQPDRDPDLKAYRLAYREAWFEDDALRHLLAHWPHYMTLDDHEIADQFALDFNPPAPYSPERYRLESTAAYRDYAHSLNPALKTDQDGREGPRLWFTFDKGATRFFVMDTRTQRFNQRGEIIDRDQMRALLSWLCKHKNALKFVVTSVPFVAELTVRPAEEKLDWYDPSRNSEQDKWTAPAFRAQREEIIEHINRCGIEHLVFLTGDMHCCYHATMRIGKGATGYASTVVHELAGGPVNQLQLARATEFARHRKARTSGEVPYEVTLERFHGDVSAVMHVKVDYFPNQRVHKDSVDAVVPEVEWNVIRTLTDPGPAGWLGDPAPVGLGKPGTPPDIKTGEEVMSGRISFARRRKPEDLVPWP